MGHSGTGLTDDRAREQFDQDCDDALAWIARFRSGSAGEDDHRAFALWLAADDQHRKALDLMLDLWDDLGSVQHLPFDEPIEEPAKPSRRRWLAGAGAMAASALLAILLWPAAEPPSDTLNFRTALGERREVALPDGSRVVLNTDSRLRVQYHRDSRTLALQQGEAYFSVVTDRERPFTVTAGAFDITAVGTAFNIRRQGDDSSDITVTEGVVRVSDRRAGSTQAPALVAADEALHVSSAGLAPKRGVDSRTYTAWQRGELIADAMPVADVLRELSRYHEQRIVAGTPEVAALTVSGVFQLDHPDTVVRALERSLGLRAEAVSSRTLRLMKADQ
jgi:transmembrane sensor